MKTESNAIINLAAVGVVGIVLTTISIGAVILACNHTPIPESFGNILTGGVGGMVGFLSRDITQALLSHFQKGATPNDQPTVAESTANG